MTTEYIWFVMAASGRTRDGAMPVMWFYSHDEAAEWALPFRNCWLEPGFQETRTPPRA